MYIVFILFVSLSVRRRFVRIETWLNLKRLVTELIFVGIYRQKGILGYYIIWPIQIFTLWIRSIKTIAKQISTNQKLSTKPFIISFFSRLYYIFCFFFSLLFFPFLSFSINLVAYSFTPFVSLSVRRRFVRIEIKLKFEILNVSPMNWYLLIFTEKAY